MPWIPAAISAGGAIIGGMSSGGGTPAIHPMDNIPDFLQDDYMGIAGGVADLQTPDYYQGQLVADQNPWTQNALQGMGGFGQEGGMGYNAANSIMGAGQQGLQGIGLGMDFMQGMQGRGPNQFQYDQGLYDQTMGNMMPGVQNQFDMGALSMQQNFDWNMLPGLNMNNALSGGQGNTRFGQAGALGQAMTNQNIANFGNQLWGNANQMANQNAYGAGSQNLGSANAFDNAMMSGYGQYGQQGAQMMGQGYGMGQQNLGIGLQAGQIQQGYDQSLIDSQMKKWNFEEQAPWIATQQKLSMLPKPGGYESSTPGMTPWQGAMEGSKAALGLYDAWKTSRA